jgi:uncharacterized iron-regulated membrane protein
MNPQILHILLVIYGIGGTVLYLARTAHQGFERQEFDPLSTTLLALLWPLVLPGILVAWAGDWLYQVCYRYGYRKRERANGYNVKP